MRFAQNHHRSLGRPSHSEFVGRFLMSTEPRIGRMWDSRGHFQLVWSIEIRIVRVLSMLFKAQSLAWSPDQAAFITLQFTELLNSCRLANFRSLLLNFLFVDQKAQRSIENDSSFEGILVQVLSLSPQFLCSTVPPSSAVSKCYQIFCTKKPDCQYCEI